MKGKELLKLITSQKNAENSKMENLLNDKIKKTRFYKGFTYESDLITIEINLSSKVLIF
jgi:hypothetical protein